MKNFFLTSLFTFFVSFSLFAQNGLKVDYYNGTNFYEFVGSQVETNIDHYWGNYSPFKDMDPHECSIRWTGRLMSPKTGEITFVAMFDDGIRVWVGDVLVIDNWQLNDTGYSKGKINMKAGEYYDIKVEYFNALHEGEIKLSWIFSRPDDLSWYERFWYEDEVEIVPAKYFFQPIEETVVELEEEEITLEKPKAITPKRKPAIPVKPTATKEVTIENYIPKNVQFERAKTEILPESFPELDKLADYLIANPHHKIKIEGHTDNVGDAEKNIQLSHSRARAVAAYLIKKGVQHERLSAEGLGGLRPLVKSEGGQYHPENRRVEFIVE